jgi:hypothetical protein
LIPDIAKFLPVSIFKMATTILQKIKLRMCHNAKCSFKPVVSGRFGRLCQESIWDIITYQYMKCRWNWTMLNLCGIMAAILKMATSRNFSMSGINSGHHNLPTYEMALKSDNVEFYYRILWESWNFVH